MKKVPDPDPTGQKSPDPDPHPCMLVQVLDGYGLNILYNKE